MKKRTFFILLLLIFAFLSTYLFISMKGNALLFAFSPVGAENVVEYNHSFSQYFMSGETNSGLVVCNNDGLYSYNKKYELLWEYPGIYHSPIIKTSGALTLVADKGAKNLTLLDGGKLRWEHVLEGEIVNVGINKTGYVWAVHEQVGHRGAVTLLSPQGVWLFTRNFAEDFIISAAISKDGSELLINSVDASEIKPNARLTFLNNKGEVFASIIHEDEIFPSVGYLENNYIIMVGDKTIICYDTKKNEKWRRSLENTQVYSVAYQNEGNVVLATSGKSEAGFFEGTSSFITLIDKNGKNQWEQKIRGQVKTIEHGKSLISVNTGSELFVFNAKGREQAKYCPGKDIRDVKNIDSTTIAVFTKDTVAILSVR